MGVHAIEVESFETVVAGGVRRVTWLVQNGDDWLLAGEWPGATVEQRDTGPRMVWLRRVTLALPPGARLVRIESEPHRAPDRDPMAYLFEPPRAHGRQSRRSYFVVTLRGKLQRVPPPSV